MHKRESRKITRGKVKEDLAVKQDRIGMGNQMTALRFQTG